MFVTITDDDTLRIIYRETYGKLVFCDNGTLYLNETYYRVLKISFGEEQGPSVYITVTKRLHYCT